MIASYDADEPADGGTDPGDGGYHLQQTCYEQPFGRHAPVLIEEFKRCSLGGLHESHSLIRQRSDTVLKHLNFEFVLHKD